MHFIPHKTSLPLNIMVDEIKPIMWKWIWRPQNLAKLHNVGNELKKKKLITFPLKKLIFLNGISQLLNKE